MFSFHRPLRAVIAAALTAASVASGAAAQDAEVTIANFRDVRDLNPHLYAGAMFAQAMIFDGLVVLDSAGSPVPALAETWEVSEDGTTYTFNLRQDVTFSDGHPFNAEVAKLNLDAILDNTERHSWLRSMRLMMEYQDGGQDSVQVIDEYTLQIHLTESYFPFIVDLAVTRPFRMLSPNCFVDGGTMDGVECYVGTGPFMLDSHTVDQEAVFVRHEGYWNTPPSLDAFVVRVIPDAQARLLALQNGEVDMIFGQDMIPPRSVADFKNQSGFGAAKSDPVATRMMIMNATAGALQDVEVRMALNLLTNREVISERILLGLEAPAGTLMASTVPYSDVGLDPYTYNPERAAELIAAAGYTLENGAWMRDGEGLSINMFYNSDNVVERTIAQYLQSEWADAGIALDISAVETQARRDRLNAGDFELAFNASWGLPYDPQGYLGSMLRPVYGDYHSQQGLDNKDDIDAAIIAALAAVDMDERQKQFAFVLEALHEGAIYIPLTYQSNLALYNAERLEEVPFNINQYEIPFDRISVQ